MKIKQYIIKLIKEELDNLTADDIVTDKLLDNFDMSSGAIEYLFQQYKSENYDIEDNDIDYDEYVEDENNKKDFEDWLMYELKYKFEKQKKLYENLFRNGGGRITLFREMTVSKSWIKTLLKPNTKLGIYWSYDEDAAEAHWGYGSKGRTEKALLQTSVTENQVDWEGTFYANLDPSIGEEEKEIRLNEGEKIPLEALWINNTEIKLNKTIKSNIYLA